MVSPVRNPVKNICKYTGFLLPWQSTCNFYSVNPSLLKMKADFRFARFSVDQPPLLMQQNSSDRSVPATP